jgi:tRNA pseudouridine65 synthase
VALTILARADGAIVVDKPSGQLVHNSAWAGPRERSLVDDVRACEGADRHPVNRIDRGASGLVVFADAAHVSAWQRALDDGDKRYLAVVRGTVRDAVDVDHAIVDEETRVARDARSRVVPLARARSGEQPVSLVEVRLFTGRKHQARRHLKHIAHPVIGDANHGKGPINRAFAERHGLGRLMLHAWSLTCARDDGVALDVRAPPTGEFARVLSALFGDAWSTRGA